MARRTFDILLVRDEDGWYTATVPSLPGVVTQGRTKAEARSNAREAIALHLAAFEDDTDEQDLALSLDRVQVAY